MENTGFDEKLAWLYNYLKSVWKLEINLTEKLYVFKFLDS